MKGGARAFLQRRAGRIMVRALRTGGRVVEGTALEMRHTGNRIEGSNPSLSAIRP